MLHLDENNRGDLKCVACNFWDVRNIHGIKSTYFECQVIVCRLTVQTTARTANKFVDRENTKQASISDLFSYKQ